MRRLLTLAVAALIALPLAADLGKYKNWNESPAGYFMTKAEREQWAQLGNEADAGKFVADFLARRDAGFSAEVTKRAEMADKYLTTGKTPGSKTLRGKLVILFGAPSAMDVAVEKRRGARTGNAATAISAGGETGGTSLSEVSDVTNREGMNGDYEIRSYSFTFPGAALPTGAEAKVVVEVNTSTGKERIADKKNAAALEWLFDQVAEASIKK